MYCSPSIEISAPWRFSRIRTRGLPPAIRVSVRASSSKIWIRSSTLRSAAGTAMRESPPTAERSSAISESCGKRLIRSAARSEKSGRSPADEDRGVARPEVVLDELAEALVRERPVLLDEAAVEDAELARDREVLQLLEQARLADARLSGDDGELTLSGDGGVQPALQLGEFLLAPDEDRERRPLDDAARGQRDRHAELVGREARLVAAQGLGDLSRLLRALGRVLLEAPHEDVLQLLADLGAEGARRLRDLVHDPVEDRLDLAREGRLADEAFIEDHAERVDVGAPVEGAAKTPARARGRRPCPPACPSSSGATRSPRGRGRSPSRGRARRRPPRG